MYKFDFSIFSSLNPPITKSDQITDAALSVFCVGGSEGTEKTYMYRIIKEWNLEEASWMECKEGERWNTSAPNDSVEYQGGLYTTEDGAETGYAPGLEWESYNVTDIVKKFIDGTPDYGFILVNDYKSGHTERLYISSEYETEKSWRPKLIINYNPIGIIFSQTINTEKGYKIIKTADLLKIYMPFNGRYTLEIADIKGRKICSYEGANEKWYQIPLHNLSNGMYMMSVSVNNNKFKEKILLVK